MKVLLYSGGMDSWLISQLWNPDIKLYIDTGTAYAEEEKRRLPSAVSVEALPMGIGYWTRALVSPKKQVICLPTYTAPSIGHPAEKFM